MNVSALSNILDPYVQSLISSTGTNTNASTSGSSIDPSSLTLPQDSAPQLSPFARILSSLQQLQQSDPDKYQQVTSQISTDLQNAAQSATAAGNTTRAAQLNKLAADFSTASQSKTLPKSGPGHGHLRRPWSPPPSSSPRGRPGFQFRYQFHRPRLDRPDTEQ